MTCRKVLFLSIFTFIFAVLHAQQVTLKYNNVKLERVFSSITKQTDYTFAYSSSVVKLSEKISVNVSNTELPNALNQLFANTDIDFEIGDDKIYLTKKAEKPKQTTGTKTKIKVSGFIADELNEVLIGATILEKGTTNGTVTGWNGDYSIQVASDAILVVSYLGYSTQEIAVQGRRDINIQLKEDENYLNEVVVTALGIEKKEESLPYSMQQIGGAEFTRAPEINLINSLTGKASNVQINRNSSGLGASSRVIIRGASSTSKNNQPLYVIDGIPILNTSSEQSRTAIGGTANTGNRDGGDGILNLNPEDIESMSILKGAAASALYGSTAANGVILINSKKGKRGVRKVIFSSEITLERPVLLPEFQNSYGEAEGTNTSWGEKANLTKYNNLGDFFQTGVSTINSIVLTTGDERSQSYFSYANTRSRGIIENSKYNKHNFNMHSSTGYFNNRFTLDGNIKFIVQDIHNKPVPGGYYMNPLVGLYTFPRGKSINEYKHNFETYDDDRVMHVQNWYTAVNDGFEQNPYWLVNRVTSDDRRYRGIALLSANLTITDWLSLQGRGSADYIHDKYRQKMYASTSLGLAGENGRYIDFSFSEVMLYGDVMAKMKRTWGDFDFQADFGASIRHIATNKLRYDSNTASLAVPNVFSIANIQMNSNAYIDEAAYKEQIQSVFGSFVLGYKEQLYLDLTVRNEWSSTLAHTESMKKGFFFPAIGSSWILTHSLTLPQWVSFGKLRASWGKVGNALTPTASNPQSKIVAGSQIQTNNVSSNYFNVDLKPEMTTSYEFGTEWRFIQNRLTADFTIYKTNTRNQLFTLPTTAGTSQYKYYNVNAGNVQNGGVELTLSGVPILGRDFKWSSALNYSFNRNVILQLHEDLNEYWYNEEDISSSYRMLLREGDSFGDIYGIAFIRNDAGEIVFDENGLPLISDTDENVKVGNCNPKFMLGWNNEFTYKDFSFYFLIDGRFGGKALSQTQAELDRRGVSKTTGIARDRGYVELEGTRITGSENIQAFYYDIVGGRSGVTEYYMYDVTNIRLREVAISYSLPEKYFSDLKFLSGVQFTLSGRNLFFLYNKAPFDPDAALSSANNNQGVDVFGTPTTRSFGFNARVKF